MSESNNNVLNKIFDNTAGIANIIRAVNPPANPAPTAQINVPRPAQPNESDQKTPAVQQRSRNGIAEVISQNPVLYIGGGLAVLALTLILIRGRR